MKSSVVISLMKEEELQDVVEIEKSCFSNPWTQDGFKAAISNKSNIYLVSKISEELIGYCGMILALDEAYISNVAIKKEYRNKNIAYTMLKELIKEGKVRSITKFILEVRISNISAINLYKKLGFKELGIRKDIYTNPQEDAIVMALF